MACYKLHVTGLPENIKYSELEHIFGRQGDIRYITLKRSDGKSSHAFIEYERNSSFHQAARRRFRYTHAGEILTVRAVVCIL